MPRRFLALDGLRGVCALSVLLYHCYNIFYKGSIFQHGYLAVDVFFILSGFVISLTYEDRLRSGGSARVFLLNRARTLFPTYWLGAALNVALFVWVTTSGYAQSGDTAWMIWILIPLTTFLLIPDYVTPDGFAYPAMGVAWSLFTEWIAYLGYAAGAFRWRTSALVILAAAGWVAMTVAGFYTGKAWCTGDGRSTLLTTGVLRCASGFIAGMVIYRIHRKAWFKRLPVISTEVLLAVWLVMAIVPNPGASPSLDAFLVVVCSPVLICLLIRSDARAPAYCSVLGGLSYPLYVVHPGILLIALCTPVFGLSHGPRLLNGLLVVGVSIALAWVIMRIAANLRKGSLTIGKWRRGDETLGANALPLN